VSAEHRDFHKIELRGPFPLTWGEGNTWESILAFRPRSSRLKPAGISRVEHPVRDRDAMSRVEQYLNQFDFLRAAFDEKGIKQTLQGRTKGDIFVCDASVFPDSGWGSESGGFRAFPGAGFRLEAFDLREIPPHIGPLHLDSVVRHLILMLSHPPFDGAAYPLLIRPLLAVIVRARRARARDAYRDTAPIRAGRRERPQERRGDQTLGRHGTPVEPSRRPHVDDRGHVLDDRPLVSGSRDRRQGARRQNAHEHGQRRPGGTDEDNSPARRPGIVGHAAGVQQPMAAAA